MTRPDLRATRFALAGCLVLLAADVCRAAPASPAPPAVVGKKPAATIGASALDALGFLRDAEARSYRLDEDGVRTLSMRVGSPAIDDLTRPGGELAGRNLRVVLIWRAGESSVAIEGAEGADPEVIASIQGLVHPLPALILPGRASRGLVGCAFRFVDSGTVLEAGDRGVQATARDESSGIERGLFAVSREGLVVGERFDRAGGRASEFRHQWLLQGGRYLLGRTEGWIPGRRVAAEITWGALVGERPMPTHVTVYQGDMMAPWPDTASRIDFDLSEHQVNAEAPSR